MVLGRSRHLNDLANGCVGKPRKPRERHERLPIVDQEPKPIGEMFVTSTAKVRFPGFPYFIAVLASQAQSRVQAAIGEPQFWANSISG